MRLSVSGVTTSRRRSWYSLPVVSQWSVGGHHVEVDVLSSPAGSDYIVPLLTWRRLSIIQSDRPTDRVVVLTRSGHAMSPQPASSPAPADFPIASLTRMLNCNKATSNNSRNTR